MMAPVVAVKVREVHRCFPAEMNLFRGKSHRKADLYSQLSSIRMKSLIPRFSRNTPEEAVVLNRKEMSALSSPWKVGKCR